MAIPMPSPPAGVDDPGDDNDDDSPDASEGTDPGMPADDNNTPDEQIVLSPQMVASSGLGDLKVGDSVMVTVKATVNDVTDGTVTADVEDALNGIKTAGDAKQAPPRKKPLQRVVGPQEAGFGDNGIPPGI